MQIKDQKETGLAISLFPFAQWVQWVALVCTSCSVIAPYEVNSVYYNKKKVKLHLCRIFTLQSVKLSYLFPVGFNSFILNFFEKKNLQ